MYIIKNKFNVPRNWWHIPLVINQFFFCFVLFFYILLTLHCSTRIAFSLFSTKPFSVLSFNFFFFMRIERHYCMKSALIFDPLIAITISLLILAFSVTSCVRASCTTLTRWVSFLALLRTFSTTSLPWMKTLNSTSRCCVSLMCCVMFVTLQCAGLCLDTTTKSLLCTFTEWEFFSFDDKFGSWFFVSSPTGFILWNLHGQNPWPSGWLVLISSSIITRKQYFDAPV